MHLSEIFTAEVSDQRWSEIINSLIQQHGLETFGGMQATVVTTPDRKHVYRLWTKDPGYEKWLAVALTMQDNPHVVKILGRPRTIPTKFKGMPADVKVKFVKLEKLSPMQHSIVAGRAFDNWTADHVHESLEEKPVQKFMDDNKSFFETCAEVNKKIRINDLNDENVMLRGDTLVLVDPVR